MAVCLTFVFLGLLEFAFVNVLTRAGSKQDKYKTDQEEEKTLHSPENESNCKLNTVSSTFQPYERRKQSVSESYILYNGMVTSSVK